MQRQLRRSELTITLLVSSLVAAVACSPPDPDGKKADSDATAGSAGTTADSSSQRDGSGAGSGGAGGDGSESTGGTGANSPGAAGDSAGGGADGSGGDATSGEAGSGGEGGEPSVSCYEQPDGLEYWWNAEPFLMPTPSEFSRIREVVKSEHAYVQGSSTYSISGGPVGMSLNFTSNIYVEAFAPTSSELALEPWPFGTLEFWFTSTQAKTNLVSIGGHIGLLPGYGVTLKDGKARAFFRMPDPDGEGSAQSQLLEITGSTTVNDGKNHHVAVVADPDELEAYLYVDGDYDGKATFPSHDMMLNTMQTMFSLIMGGDSYGSTAFVGQIDDVSLFGSPLSAEQVDGIYEAGSAGKCPD